MSIIKNQPPLESAIGFESENNIYFTSSKFFPKFRGEKLNTSFQNVHRNKFNEYSIKREDVLNSKEKFVTKENSFSNYSVLDIGIRVLSLDGRQVTETKSFNNGKFSPLFDAAQIKGNSPKKSKKTRNIIMSRVRNGRSISQMNKRKIIFETESKTDISKLIYCESENKSVPIDPLNRNRSFSELHNVKTLPDEITWDNHNFINYKTSNENLFKLKDQFSIDKNERRLQKDLLKNQKEDENCSHLKSFVNIKFDPESNKKRSSPKQNIMPGKIRPSTTLRTRKALNKPIKSSDPNFNFNTFAKLEPIGNLNKNQNSLIKLFRNDSNQTTNIDNSHINSFILNQIDMSTEDLNKNFIDDNHLLIKPRLSNSKFIKDSCKNISFILRNENKSSFLRTRGEIEKKSIENYNNLIMQPPLMRAQTSLKETKTNFRKKPIMRSKTPLKNFESPIRSMMKKLSGFTGLSKIQRENIKKEIGDASSNRSDDITLREYIGKEKTIELRS